VVRDRPTDIRLSSKKARRSPQAVAVARAQAKQIIIPITLRALTQRLARHLARDGRTLRKTRAAPARSAIGDYYVVDCNGIVAHHVDLVQLAREIGVLQNYEHLIAES
jgi:hypothetical protein